MKPILITTGEPAGIGPDLCVQLGQMDYPYVLMGDLELLKSRARALNLAYQFVPWDAQEPIDAGAIRVWHMPLSVPVCAGELNVQNSHYVYDLLKQAALACLQGTFSALVTAPVHKGIINDAGIHFTGHTEFFAEISGVKDVVMMLVCEQMKVALVTTHLPLSEVALAITPRRLAQTIALVDVAMRRWFHCPSPRLLVAGLNPHAGEGGHLGREEIEVMIPVLQSLKDQGLHIQGPLPADTLFTRQRLVEGDVVIAMYHDQGLPVLKYAGFGAAVNVTLGLPFIRTSVDHGTALPLAGTGHADLGSLKAAVTLAKEMLA